MRDYKKTITQYCAERNIDEAHAEHFVYLLEEAVRNRPDKLYVARVHQLCYHPETSRDSIDFASLALAFTKTNWDEMVPHVVAPDLKTAASHLAFNLRQKMSGYPGWRVGGGERFTFRITYSALEKSGNSFDFWPTTVRQTIAADYYEVKNGEVSKRNEETS